MARPTRPPAQALDEKRLKEVRLMIRVEEDTLARVRDYLGRGRPLAGVPAQTLNAQWISAYLEVRALDDRSRADELRDLGTELDLRGLRPPLLRVMPEVDRFKERFARDLHKPSPDPAVIERAERELEDLCDRLIMEQREDLPA